MKKLIRVFSVVLCFLFAIHATAQNVAINNDGSAPNAGAMLDVKSTNKGILIPRLDYNNRPTGTVPSGMLIYVTANGPLGNNAYYYYNGTAWLKERSTTDVQTLSLNNDTLNISEGNYVVVGNILNQIGYYKCPPAGYVHLANDNNNCGSCGNVCNYPNASSSCVSSTCTLNCNAGFGNCDNITGNGCETNLMTAVSNCGSCGNVCPVYANTTGATCTGGACGVAACTSGFGNCDNLASNGCEVNLTNSLNNCGSCGITCPSYANTNATCVSSVCGFICTSGFGNCDNIPANGCETNLSTVNNCGGCGITCPSYANTTSTCVAANCGFNCSAGFGNCDNITANGCETNLTNNVNNCGGCGIVCPNYANTSSRTCTGSVCGFTTCNAGYANCDNNTANGCEVNISTDHNNCGNCGNVCPGVKTCVNGACI